MKASSSSSAAVMQPILKVSERVVRIMGLNPGPMTLQGSNTYLVGTGPQRLLVDSGEGVPGYLHLLREALELESRALGRRVSVDKLFLTHWHADHVGGATALLSLFPDMCLYKKPSRYATTDVDELCSRPPPRIAVEGATLTVLETPGHTDDHLCLFLEEEASIFTSDTVLGEGTSVFSCYTDFMQSLRLMESLAPQRLYPAHGPVVEDAVPRIRQILQHRQQREDQILQTLQRRASRDEEENDLCIRDLVDEIYAKTTPKSLLNAAGINVFHQLKHLIETGRVAVVATPSMEQDVLSRENDYAMLGEGSKTDEGVMNCIFTELRVKAKN